MLSDIGGIINPDIEKIASFLKKNNILLLEDAAHSFGAKLNNKFAGTFGDAEFIPIILQSYICGRGRGSCYQQQ